MHLASSFPPAKNTISASLSNITFQSRRQFSGGILDEAAYLHGKGYLRASAVLIGAALEEGLKNLAKAIPIEIGPKETLGPLLIKLKAPGIAALTEYDAKRLESVAKMRNDAAHGGDFEYEGATVLEALETVRTMLDRLLRQ